ncbi:MAG: hypothetical protein HS110_06855 [Zoogloeaceae bacterium]|nr:hypothetical protein [Zoogloeaceae bacterium]MCK6383518.1 hypothetical protein [Rhodocyclaceae bacterium]
MSSDYSKGALLKFLDTVVAKGLMNTNTAGGLKAACLRILDDLADADDVRKVDVNTAVIRYNNRNPGILSPNSLAEYQRRVARAIADFVSWTEDPIAFKPRTRGASGKNGGKTENPSSRRTAAAPREEPTTVHVSPMVAAMPGLSLNYPLRQDFLAHVVIPRDLTVEEARRLGAFLLTLAADYRPAGAGGVQ